MSFNKKESEEYFDKFLMVMDDQLENIINEAKNKHIILDKSLNDLENLEDLFDLMSDDLMKDQASGLIVLFARYLGELMVSNHGGKWTLPLDNEKNVNFNTPVITGHSPIKGLEFAPISTMRAYSVRRKKGTIRRSFNANINPINLDIDHLIEE